MLLAALAATPSLSPPPATAGDLAFANGDFANAALNYGMELAASPHDSHALLRLGEIALYANELDQAERAFRAIPAGTPDADAAAHELGVATLREAELAKRTTIDGSESIVPLLGVDPLPYLRVRVNGVDAVFLIDTGAPNIVLDPDFARQLGLSVTQAGVGTFLGGRHAAVESTTVARIDIGSAHAYDVSATVLPTANVLPVPSARIAGILGTGLFERFLATLDYPRARLILRTRDAAASVAFERDATANGATVERCWLVSDHLVFATAQVNDAPPGLFLFDSGLAGGGLMPTAALVAAAHITLDTAHAGTGMGGGGAVTVVPFVASSVAVGNAVQHDVPGSYTPQGTPFGAFPFTVDGAISHIFLKHYAYTVDFTAMKIVLQPEQ